MHFTKWHGCGNDYVFVNGFEEDFDSVYPHIVEISDRHFGVGSDGVIFLLPSDKADIQMKMYNNDASEGEMCGNGIRCLARWAFELGLVKEKRFSVETGAGILFPEILDDGSVRVDMGAPHLLAEEIPVKGFGEGKVIAQEITSTIGKTYPITCVSMGNPHAVIFVDHISDIDLPKEGSALEVDAHFPKKCNIEFVEKLGDHHFRMRVWERGTGITMACGTGTCATVVAAILNHLTDGYADVDLDGGTLHIEWDGNPESHVFMTGPAVKVFEGDYFAKEASHA